MDAWSCGIPDDEFYSMVEHAEYEIAMAVADAADEEERNQSDFEEPDFVTCSWAPPRRTPSTSEEEEEEEEVPEDDDDDFVDIDHLFDDSDDTDVEMEEEVVDHAVLNLDETIADLEAELERQEDLYWRFFSSQPQSAWAWRALDDQSNYINLLHDRLLAARLVVEQQLQQQLQQDD